MPQTAGTPNAKKGSGRVEALEFSEAPKHGTFMDENQEINQFPLQNRLKPETESEEIFQSYPFLRDENVSFREGTRIPWQFFLVRGGNHP